jgi:5-formyltetrahydrofolate cyclo-ligase
MDKAALRKALVARRARAFEATDQTAAQTRLRNTLAPCEGPVSFYWPIRTEIDPRPAINALRGVFTFCLPLTHGRRALSFLTWTPDAPMTVDGFNVPMPDGTAPVVPRTLVVPLLAFDSAGHRLGYGAGHYDRTLETLRANGPVRAIGFAFEAQRLEDDLPAEPTDQPLDVIVTERQTHAFGV